MTSSNIVGSSSATSTIGGAAFAFTMTMIEELACFGQVLSSIGRGLISTSNDLHSIPAAVHLEARDLRMDPQAARWRQPAPSLQSSRKPVGTRVVDSTSSLLAVTYLTMVGM